MENMLTLEKGRQKKQEVKDTPQRLTAPLQLLCFCTPSKYQQRKVMTGHSNL